MSRERRSRCACLLVADLPLAAALRADPELRDRPLAIAGGPGPRAELLSVSPEAAQRGVRPGTSVAQARSVDPALCVRVSSPALTQAARDALLDAAFACAPRAALDPPRGGVFASEAAAHACAAGTAAVFHSEEGFAAALEHQAGMLGLPAHVAVASSRAVARIAARRLGLGGDGGKVAVLSPEQESAFLASLPLELLDPDDELAAALTRFGVHTVRDLLALPRRGLRSRLGPRALALVELARGCAPEAPLPERREPRVAEGIDLEAPLERLEPLLFAVRALLARLLERLAARQRVCGALELRLALEGGGRAVRRIALAAPSGEGRVLLRRIRSALESCPPPAAVESVRLEAEGAAPRGAPLDLFRPAGPAPAALDETLAALQSLCGEARVGAPLAADSHHPDAYAVAPFAAPAARDPEALEGRPGVLALRALRPPAPAEVRLHGQRPAWVRSPVANGAVLRCAGPWRTTGGWWSDEERFAFDSYDIQTEDGCVARLRFDHVRRAWQVEALYD